MTLIQETSLGSITLNYKEYKHDVIILPDGSIKKRRAENPLIIELSEVKQVARGAKILIIGTGQAGKASLTKEAREWLEKQGILLLENPTPHAIKEYNALRNNLITAIMNVT